MLNTHLKTLNERTHWAIDYVVNKKGLSNKKLSILLYFNKNTINSYRRMATAPSVDFVVRFCKEFKFNAHWFLFGAGEPFPGAREEVPQICGPVDNATLIGNRITRRREALGISQTELMQRMGVTLDMLRTWESGILPAGILLRQLAGALKCTEEWIRDGEGNLQSPAPSPKVPEEPLPQRCPPGIDPFAQAVSQLKAIYDSRLPLYIQAIETSLQSLDHAVRQARESRRLQEKLDLIGKAASKLKVDSLIKKT
ncbi:MAG: helix-turn-helix domain-containing protein [Deltaproteobacteria bacterium]|nr:helix-turn-helix domain-containing protein [Deltaproteobacteria bacterium]